MAEQIPLQTTKLNLFDRNGLRIPTGALAAEVLSAMQLFAANNRA
jgi:hypothetical protein